MYKYSDNFFFTSNNILRGFSLLIYIIMSPPLRPPFYVSNFNTKFDGEIAGTEKCSYICSGNQ